MAPKTDKENPAPTFVPGAGAGATSLCWAESNSKYINREHQCLGDSNMSHCQKNSELLEDFLVFNASVNDAFSPSTLVATKKGRTKMGATLSNKDKKREKG
ncbi:unnamed protein product [Dovyalis caffra]|uniref:Uncharacterized protein n=1 Tax=Dovyalis caffra TaxID=77055 RepID=A0AAV1SHY5_9ROSI|nr:unnamed protein product [Dovyalis caffra]